MHAIKYLGTFIPSDLSCTYELNFPPLLTETHVLLEGWHKGLHSWFSRCNLIEMSVLPKFLYLFQTLPIQILSKFFTQVHSLFTKFVWAHSKPCLPRRYLTLPKHYWGLALPDVKKYFLAVHLGRLIDWSHHETHKTWVQIEQAQTTIPLKGIVWCPSGIPNTVKSHSLMGARIRLGSKAISSASLSTGESPLFPILGNPAFPLGLGRFEFKALSRTGQDCALHFLEGDHWPSLQSLMDNDGCFQLPFWSAIQLHHFLHSLANPSHFNWALTTFEEYCVDDGTLPQVLSKTYALLNSPPEQPQLSLLQKWEADLNRTYRKLTIKS